MSVSKKPMVLVILDGYGYREDSQDNAIFQYRHLLKTGFDQRSC